MRGSSLSHPDVLEILRPFLVTGWNGAHNRRIPVKIQSLLRKLGKREENNVTFFVLDADGGFIGGFHPFPGMTPSTLNFSPEKMGKYLHDRIADLTPGIDLPDHVSKGTELTLPDIDGGIRMFLSSENMKGSALVYTLERNEAIRKALEWKGITGKIDAALFESWLSRVYPDGTMEKGVPYKAVLGELAWKKAGKEIATLTGEFRMPLASHEGLAFDGTFKAVLEYENKKLKSIRCVIRGTYPKKDRFRGNIRKIGVEVALESRPRKSPGK